MKPLTPKQQRFVREYLIDLNATGAYRRAGYTSGNPDVCGPRLLGKVGIQAALQAALAERSKRTEITADFVLGSLNEVALRCMQKVPVMVGQGPYRRQAVDQNGEGVWEFDSGGANRALELLGKHLGLFPSKVEMTGKDGKDLFSPAQLLRAAEEIKAKGGR